MTYGFRFVWVEDDLPLGGDVSIYDDHGDIVCFLKRRAFEEDPEGFMDTLARHCDANTKGYGWRLSVAV